MNKQKMKYWSVYPDLDLIFLRRQSCYPNGGHNMPWMGSYFLNLIADIVNDQGDEKH